MKITQVTIGKKFTYNLGNYSNVQPSAVFTAEVEAGDDLEAVKAQLATLANEQVCAEIDRTLEQQGDAPKFYQGPRYDLVMARQEDYAVVIPHDIKRGMPGKWADASTVESGHRFEAIWKIARSRLLEYEIIDCSDGDFSALPELFEFRYWSTDIEGAENYLLICPGEVKRDDLPESWHNGYYTRSSSATRFMSSFLRWAAEFARDNKFTLINCLDGDLSRVPELKPKETPAQVEDEDDEVPFDDDDDDDDEPYDDEAITEDIIPF